MAIPHRGMMVGSLYTVWKMDMIRLVRSCARSLSDGSTASGTRSRRERIRNVTFTLFGIARNYWICSWRADVSRIITHDAEMMIQQGHFSSQRTCWQEDTQYTTSQTLFRMWPSLIATGDLYWTCGHCQWCPPLDIFPSSTIAKFALTRWIYSILARLYWVRLRALSSPEQLIDFSGRFFSLCIMGTYEILLHLQVVVVFWKISRWWMKIHFIFRRLFLVLHFQYPPSLVSRSYATASTTGHAMGKAEVHGRSKYEVLHLLQGVLEKEESRGYWGRKKDE